MATVRSLVRVTITGKGLAEEWRFLRMIKLWLAANPICPLCMQRCRSFLEQAPWVIYLHEVAGTGSLERQMGHMMADLEWLCLAKNRSMEYDSHIMGQNFYLNGIPYGFHHPV